MLEHEAAETEEVSAFQRYPDVWHDDEAVLACIQGQSPPAGLSESESRIARRSRSFAYQSGKLYRTMSSGVMREVPPPDQRVELVKHMHELTGHFGVKRSAFPLQLSYWWYCMVDDVRRVIAVCAECDRVKQSFNAQQPVLRPLPIEGLFYRWGVDTFGPLRQSSYGNTYVCVCVEYLS
jgi:hypothetical protein